jgi:magnesium-transporting ATPase (P-type)
LGGISKGDQQQVWHSLDTCAALDALGSAPKGLSASVAQQRFAEYGPNRLPEPPRRGPLLRFLLQFHHLLIYVLIVAAMITAALAHWVDTVVILLVVLANAVIGFIQEGKAEKAMEAIRQMLAPKASVIRDGQRQSVPSESVVPGDIVLLEAGDRVPADLRLIEAHGLSAQEAMLTGESIPSEKTIAVASESAPIGDRHGVVFSGTLISSGQGKGVAFATGAATEIGRISGMLSAVETLTTPLVKQMEGFAKWLTILILLVSGVLLVFGYFVGHLAFAELFMVVVGLAVAAIPEGLPAVLTITLAVGVQAMARRNAIVRRLPAIETLGSVSIICTDKTGTLTRNEMMVVTAATANAVVQIDGVGYTPDGQLYHHDQKISADAVPALRELGLAAALCNDAALAEDNGVWHVVGDPMEGALLSFGCKLAADYRVEQDRWLRLDTISFDSRHRYMATSHRGPVGEAAVFVKGAPERILSMCRHQRADGGGVEPLDLEFWHSCESSIARQGQRVLAFAIRVMPDANTHQLHRQDIAQGLIFIGMVGFIDPPRPESVAAVAECRAAGIRVKMITGDHAITATAIAQQIGLENTERVLTGQDLDAMSDIELRDAALDCDIFARTSPEHKLRLVMAFQARGLTVAMTGDGVNDAPALKRSDAGIAMGLKGSEAAKEAADIVLADDNFATIVSAVREGRTVYNNIKKVISWTLPTNAGEALTIIIALLLGLSLPVTAIQILWVNLITAVTLGLALAFEPAEDDIMKRPPRARGEALIGGELLWHIVLVSMLFLAAVYGVYTYALDRGYSVALSRTLAVNTLVMLEIFHLLFIRNFHARALHWRLIRGTPAVWLTIAIVVAAQFLMTYVPVFQKVFATEPIPLWDAALVLAVGLVFFAVIEAEKQLRYRLRRSD